VTAFLVCDTDLVGESNKSPKNVDVDRRNVRIRVVAWEISARTKLARRRVRFLAAASRTFEYI
jgi:hypothetical protein